MPNASRSNLSQHAIDTCWRVRNRPSKRASGPAKNAIHRNSHLLPRPSRARPERLGEPAASTRWRWPGLTVNPERADTQRGVRTTTVVGFGVIDGDCPHRRPGARGPRGAYLRLAWLSALAEVTRGLEALGDGEKARWSCLRVGGRSGDWSTPSTRRRPKSKPEPPGWIRIARSYSWYSGQWRRL